jgi:protein TonB
MTSNEILQANVLDILFDNRNKQYGAYTLRKYYNNRLGLSLGIALGLVLLLFFFISQYNSGESFSKPKPEVIVKTFDLPARVKKQETPARPKAQRPPKQVTQVEFKRLVVTENIHVKTDLADQASLEHAQVSAKSITGAETTGATGPVDRGSPSVVTKSDEKKPDPVEMMQREPEFPGGMQAWIGFLSRNLRVPEELGAGEKKTVLIRFQVGTDGAVTGFEILQSGGTGYDHEVIRVLKRMPRWKPAIQNNLPVSRSFTQPVTFVGVEE